MRPRMNTTTSMDQRMLVTVNAGPADRRAGSNGFTLIEMAVVMAIICILATVAYPSYLSQKVRANRAAAQVLLTNLAYRQQQYFLDARAYSTDLAALGYSAPGADISAIYTIDTPVIDNSASPPSFVITATPRSGTMQANDGQLKLTSAGAKTRGVLPW